MTFKKIILVGAAVVYGHATFVAAVTPEVSTEVEAAISKIPDRRQADELLKAAVVMVKSDPLEIGARDAARKRLLASGVEDLALLAIDDGGHWLSSLEERKDWSPRDVPFLVRAILKYSMPDEARPTGEREAGRTGGVFRLAVLLCRSLDQPPPYGEPLFYEGRISDVRAWLRKTLNAKSLDRSNSAKTVGVLSVALGWIDKQKQLPPP